MNSTTSNSRSVIHEENQESRNKIIEINLNNVNIRSMKRSTNNKVHIQLESSLNRYYCNGCMRILTNKYNIQLTCANMPFYGKNYG